MARDFCMSCRVLLNGEELVSSPSMVFGCREIAADRLRSFLYGYQFWERIMERMPPVARSHWQSELEQNAAGGYPSSSLRQVARATYLQNMHRITFAVKLSMRSTSPSVENLNYAIGKLQNKFRTVQFGSALITEGSRFTTTDSYTELSLVGGVETVQAFWWASLLLRLAERRSTWRNVTELLRNTSDDVRNAVGDGGAVATLEAWQQLRSGQTLPPVVYVWYAGGPVSHMRSRAQLMSEYIEALRTMSAAWPLYAVDLTPDAERSTLLEVPERERRQGRLT
jgi:hypothetical protein